MQDNYKNCASLDTESLKSQFTNVPSTPIVVHKHSLNTSLTRNGKPQIELLQWTAKSLIQNLRRYIKKATEYCVHCHTTTLTKPIVPTSLLETVYDIKYFAHDQRRTVLKKADVEKIIRGKSFDSSSDFPTLYLTAKFIEDENPVVGGYQK